MSIDQDYQMYSPISKTARLGDGSLLVSGYASSEATDADGDVITAQAMQDALPDYMQYGNIRAMHNPQQAVGVALSATIDAEKRTNLTVHVVDKDAVQKIISGVYKGFSIGGRILERQGKTITALELIEISLVDRPANPEARIVFYKNDAVIKDASPISTTDESNAVLVEAHIAPTPNSPAPPVSPPPTPASVSAPPMSSASVPAPLVSPASVSPAPVSDMGVMHTILEKITKSQAEQEQQLAHCLGLIQKIAQQPVMPNTVGMVSAHPLNARDATVIKKEDDPQVRSGLSCSATQGALAAIRHVHRYGQKVLQDA